MSDPRPFIHAATAAPGRGVDRCRWVLLYTRGLIVDQHLRRLTMFYVVIAAMLMAFAGDVPGGCGTLAVRVYLAGVRLADILRG